MFTRLSVTSTPSHVLTKEEEKYVCSLSAAKHMLCEQNNQKWPSQLDWPYTCLYKQTQLPSHSNTISELQFEWDMAHKIAFKHACRARCCNLIWKGSFFFVASFVVNCVVTNSNLANFFFVWFLKNMIDVSNRKRKTMLIEFFLCSFMFSCSFQPVYHMLWELHTT